MKIFLLEDDYLLNKAINQYLASKGFTVSSFPQDGLTTEQLLTIADHKMYHQKNQFYGLIG